MLQEERIKALHIIRRFINFSNSAFNAENVVEVAIVRSGDVNLALNCNIHVEVVAERRAGVVYERVTNLVDVVIVKVETVGQRRQLFARFLFVVDLRNLREVLKIGHLLLKL